MRFVGMGSTQLPTIDPYQEFSLIPLPATTEPVCLNSFVRIHEEVRSNFVNDHNDSGSEWEDESELNLEIQTSAFYVLLDDENDV